MLIVSMCVSHCLSNATARSEGLGAFQTRKDGWYAPANALMSAMPCFGTTAMI